MSCGRPLTHRLSDRRDLITATATDVSCLHEVLTRRINPGSWAFVPGVTGAPDTFLLSATPWRRASLPLPLPGMVLQEETKAQFLTMYFVCA